MQLPHSHHWKTPFTQTLPPGQVLIQSSTMNKIPALPLLFTFSLLITTSLSLVSPSSIHDLLKSKGLPGGLFPKNVKSYTLAEDGLLEVNMGQPCEARFETLIRFESVVRANLSYGGLIGVQGLTQEELFLWLPVKDIIVNDPSSGLILFDIGVAQKQLAISMFEEPPVCNPQWSYIHKVGRKEKGAHEAKR